MLKTRAKEPFFEILQIHIIYYSLMALNYKISCAIAVTCLMLSTSEEVRSQAGQFEINNSSYANPDYIIERDGDGYFIAVWTDARDAFFYGDTFGINEEYAVYGRIFDPSLNPIGTDFRISDLYENGTVAHSGLDLLVLEDGRFVVTWTKVLPSSSGPLERSVMMVMYNRNGELLLEEHAIDDPESDSMARFNPKISRIPGNQYLITWQEGANQNRIRKGRRFDIETGEPMAGIEELDFQLEFPIITSHYQQLYVDEERFMVVSAMQHLYYFDSELNRIGEMIDLHDSLELDENKSLHPLFQMNRDTLLIPFSTDLGGRLWFRLADYEGNALTETIQVTDNEPLQPHDPLDLAVDSTDGSYMLIWTDRRNGNPVPLSFSGGDIYAQRFDANGDHVGSNFKVNHEPRKYFQGLPTILHHENGQFLAIWYELRDIVCPTPGVVTINAYHDYYLTARIVDYNDPQPGPVYSWDSYLRERQRKCSNVSESRVFYNYPNPFNERTTIKVDLQTEESIRVDVQIFDVLGRLVWSNFAEGLTEGSWLFHVNLEGLPSGTYIARFTSPQLQRFSDTTKMLLIR